MQNTISVRPLRDYAFLEAMELQSHADPTHDREESLPHLALPQTAPTQQRTVLPPPDSLLAGVPSYASTMRGPSQDQQYHAEPHGMTYSMTSPTSSVYGTQYSDHPPDQLRQPQGLHTSESRYQSGFSAPQSRHPQYFPGSQESQSRPNVPQATTQRLQSSWIPNLLGPNREPAIDAMQFSLVVRQQPRAARACGFGDRDRRVIDPPPIVQLKIDGPGLSEEEKRAYLRYSHYVLNCSILDSTGTRDASYMPDEYQHQRRLMGTPVATPFVGEDDRGVEGCFFCFSDLSCRTPGPFRLKFSLILIDPARAAIVKHFPMLTDTKTEVFHVYSAKEFPGMAPSSELAKRLKEQGCIISIKKGNERARARGRDGRSDDEDE
ncbi:hypothetical protein NQ176_g8945 [Zarea fungicola]|uniref:Uncharacterized protein n=1 Tax=Zarea fungicola TaxID=93591 RepID=A0ACC1MQ18_9HYPO|nr:hypothetical protein NQ176_g8945 [Lecanicillium fungicola]